MVSGNNVRQRGHRRSWCQMSPRSDELSPTKRQHAQCASPPAAPTAPACARFGRWRLTLEGFTWRRFGCLPTTPTLPATCCCVISSGCRCSLVCQQVPPHAALIPPDWPLRGVHFGHVAACVNMSFRGCETAALPWRLVCGVSKG